MKKKFTAIIILAVMVFALLPAGAFADDYVYEILNDLEISEGIIINLSAGGSVLIGSGVTITNNGIIAGGTSSAAPAIFDNGGTIINCAIGNITGICGLQAIFSLYNTALRHV